MMPRAGRMRHRVSIQSATDVQDGSYGATTQTWATDETRWMAVEPLRGRELFLAQQVNSEASIRVLMRGDATVTPKHRLLFGTRVLQVVSVIDRDERGIDIECLCKELT